MKRLSKKLAILVLLSFGMGSAVADNQTTALSPVLPQDTLPFHIQIQQANFQLPTGLQAFVFGVYRGQWIILAGRIDGLHAFNGPSFPPSGQNRSIYVINPASGAITSRSLTDPASGLNQQQIDTLSTTFAAFYQEGNTLYMSGGYGIDTASGTFSTKPVLTAINLPGIIQWVTQPGNRNNSVAKNIRQINNPTFQISGGKMAKLGNMTQLIFGQNFTGPYTSAANGNYSEQIRQFQITNAGGQLGFTLYPSIPSVPNPNFRRRDLNVMPVMLDVNNILQYGFVAFAGVFTETSGAWTVPVFLTPNSDPIMPDPNADATFKQAMSQYQCATTNLYSRRTSSTYNIFLGGITYGFFQNGVFQTDAELPFTNQITTIKMDKNNNFTQYIMDGEYPAIPSRGIDPGNNLLFGAAAFFIPANILQYPNSIINFDSIRQPTVIGYVVGGIMSTVPNTVTDDETTASPYVFQVTLVPS